VNFILRKIMRLSLEWKVICKESKLEKTLSWLSFSGDVDPRVIEDNKRNKLYMKGSSAEYPGYGIPSKA
jgi:hypothetical protein